MGIRAERMTRMATIEIKMLGGFEIRVNGKPVLAQLAQSRKATALVQYLVLRRGERVSHKVLTDTLWAGERSTNPDMALRAILHRFRLMIDAEGLDEMKDCIVTSRGYYQWNPHLDCSVDVFEVNDLSEMARKESDAEKRSRIYEQIVNLYDGRLLPQSASEPWVESVSVRLHGQYRTAILNLLELCKKMGREHPHRYAVYPRAGAGPLRGTPLSGKDRRAGDAGPPRGGGGSGTPRQRHGLPAPCH